MIAWLRNPHKKKIKPNFNPKSIAEPFHQIADFFFQKMAEVFPRDLATVVKAPAAYSRLLPAGGHCTDWH